MGADTRGRIKGRIVHEEILNYIRQKYDPKATSNVNRECIKPISTITWDYKINENADEKLMWCIDSGYITFNYQNEKRMLFYFYDNINHFENMDYYSSLGLKEMVETETTSISLNKWGHSIDIIREIVSQFGGWIDENDCDDDPYIPVNLNEDKTIKPVIRVTKEELYNKYGGVVIIEGVRI